MAICPHCGGQLDTMAVSCHACGWDFPEEALPVVRNRPWWLLFRELCPRWVDCYLVPIAGCLIGMLARELLQRNHDPFAILAIMLVFHPLSLLLYVLPVGTQLVVLRHFYPDHGRLIIYGGLLLFALSAPLALCWVAWIGHR